ncbi:MAG: CvpA family protein [Bacteroidales bacterium]|nr:CvpA family protein [Bacteroidales bacterium]
MNILDIIILICFVPALVQGLRKGFISQIVSIVSILLGVYLSFQFSTALSVWLAQYIEGSEQVLKIVSFALILVGVMAGLTLLSKLLEGFVKFVMLGWLNKLLGVLFSFLKCALIVGLVIMAFNSLNNSLNLISEEELAKSVLYPPLKDLAYTVFPYLKDMLFWK